MLVIHAEETSRCSVHSLISLDSLLSVVVLFSDLTFSLSLWFTFFRARPRSLATYTHSQHTHPPNPISRLVAMKVKLNRFRFYYCFFGILSLPLLGLA